MFRVVALGALVAGCSFATMKDPPARIRGKPDCTTSRRPPAVDLAATFLTGTLTVLAVGVMVENEGDAPILATGVVGLGVSLGFLVSSLEGFGRASSCEESIDLWIKAGSPPAW